MNTENYISETRIGVISDTHGNLSEDIWALFDGVQMIIHAGDIGTRWVLNELETIAPVYAVCGNMDSGSLSDDQPNVRIVRAAGVQIYVIHDITRLKIDPVKEGVRIVIHGHTHRRQNEYKDGVLYLNPGAVSHARGESASVAVLKIKGDTLEPEFFSL